MAGVSDKLGFNDPTEGCPNPPGSKMGLPQAGKRAPAQLNVSEPIGIQPAQPPGQQAQHGGPRLPDFSKGMTEGFPGMGGDAAAGGAEAAGGADLLAEAAPLALAAL